MALFIGGFILGLLIGMIIGIITMCLVQINHNKEE